MMVVAAIIASLATPAFQPAMVGANPPRIFSAGVVDYASCLARYHPREVAAALDSGLDGDFETALARVPPKKCEHQTTAGSTPSLRGALFAVMYDRFGPAAGRTASNILHTWMPNLAATDPRYGWYVLSACLVNHEPVATRSIVRASVGDDGDPRARDEIVAALPQCLPGGMRVSVNMPSLVGYLAETIYQIDFAVGPGEKKHFWSDLY